MARNKELKVMDRNNVEKRAVDPMDIIVPKKIATLMGGMNRNEAVLASVYYDLGEATESVKANSTKEEYLDAIVPETEYPLFEASRILKLDSGEDPSHVERVEEAFIYPAPMGCTYINEDGYAGALCDPVIVGTKERALGIFIPFGADSVTTDWACGFFGDINDAQMGPKGKNAFRKCIFSKE